MKSLNQMKPKHRKIVDACRAMKSFGITPAKTKTALKGLLKLYENNWELIEDENYRVLFDVLMPEEEVYLYFLFFNSVRSSICVVWFMELHVIISEFCF